MAGFRETLSRMQIQKNVIESFKVVDLFQTSQKCIFTFDTINKTENGEVIKNDNKHIVTFDAIADYQSYGNKIFSSSIQLNQERFYCKDSLITTISFDNIPLLRYEVTISNMCCGKKSNFYRMILPLEKDIDLCRLFDNYSFCFNEMGWSIELIKTYIEGREFHIFILSNKGKKYIFLDCMATIDYEKFYDHCVCILCSLGILTGYFIENECFIISSNDSDFSTILYKEFRPLRESKFAIYKILPDNPYNFFPSNEAKNKYNLMAHIPSDIFTKLVNKTNLSLTLENSLFIFLESFSYPLDTQPACLSVVLEGLCNYVRGENEKAFKPIPNKTKANKLKEEMYNLLDAYQSEFAIDGRAIVEKRINDINSPTNRSKFEKAIELLGLKLKNYEKEALMNRNTFLHCTEELKIDFIIMKKDSPEYLKLFFASQVLIRLLYKMILKIIGYEGNIVNILKYNEDSFVSIKNEPMLIRI